MALRDVAQLGSAPALGAGCRRFESCHPDLYVVILVIARSRNAPYPHCCAPSPSYSSLRSNAVQRW